MRKKKTRISWQPFYNISIEKPKIKCLYNIDVLHKLSFSDELNTVETPKAFKWYAKRCSIELIKDKDGTTKDPLNQFAASKPSIRDFFRDLLIKIKGFKYKIVLKAFWRKQKEIRDTEFRTVYFNSTTKTAIDLDKYGLNKSF